ncbi:MAG: hypothetical protein FJ405_04045 [Verrucomicrobia bacterium]|nr:hypothetical protein [Verrucomicrobiota bacterium]
MSVTSVNSDTQGKWALKLTEHDLRTACSLRLIPGVEVNAQGPDCWIRGPGRTPALTKLLLALPALLRLDQGPDGKWRQNGSRFPDSSVPQDGWLPMSEFIDPTMPRPRISSPTRLTCPLRLVRDPSEVRPTLLQISTHTWNQWVAEVSRIRLKPLTIAWDGADRVLVRGWPLPPLSGTRWAFHGNVAVPAGYSWMPKVSLGVLERMFEASGERVSIWMPEGPFLRLHGECFVPASRVLGNHESFPTEARHAW